MRRQTATYAHDVQTVGDALRYQRGTGTYRALVEISTISALERIASSHRASWQDVAQLVGNDLRAERDDDR